jgi:hypothetical protein
VQARVSAGIRPLHEEDALPVAQDDIRDQLLEGRVLLGDGTLQEAAGSSDRAPQATQLSGMRGSDAGEVAAAGNVGARQDQNALRHWAESMRRRAARRLTESGSQAPFRPPFEPLAANG